MQISGLPSNVSTDWADPSLWVDEEGRLVLFILYAPFGQGDPARCSPGVASCTKQILSATEVPGSNGTQFVVDPGDRATVTLSGSRPPSTASDPDVFFDGTQYVLYISHGPSTSVWTSPTLRGTYTQSTMLPNGLLSNNTGGVPAGYFEPSTMQYWTYAHVSQAGVSVIRRAIHSGLSQQLGATSWTTVMSGSGMGFSSATSVESPSFALLATDAPAPTDANPYATCSMLDPPKPLTFAVVGSAVTLVWGGAAGASSYLVQMGTSPGAADLLARETGTPETSITVRNVPTGTYYIRVLGRNECSTGSASAEVTATIR
jgi:hypothetical protein